MKLCTLLFQIFAVDHPDLPAFVLGEIAEKIKQQVHVAYKGLSQLHQFDSRSAASFSVSLEQNPFPKPDNYVDKRTKAVDKVLEENDQKK